MVKIVKGSIFDSNCIVLVNPVNCVGISGKGLALEFKNKFPNNYKQYRRHCLDGYMRMGHVFITVERDSNKFIANFPTKNHWKEKSNVSDIADGLRDLSNYVINSGILSVAFPLLGCGEGGLSRQNVEPLIHRFDEELKTRQVDDGLENIIELYV